MMRRWEVLLLFLIPTFAVLQDANCAKYGNGFLKRYKEIYHGAYITYINGAMLTHGKERDFAAIIWPDMTLHTTNGDTLLVEKLTKYALNQDRLLVGVKAPSPTIIEFPSQEAIIAQRPTVLQSMPEAQWVDLEQKPLLVYFWRPIVLLLIAVEVGLLVWTVLQLFRRAASSREPE